MQYFYEAKVNLYVCNVNILPWYAIGDVFSCTNSDLLHINISRCGSFILFCFECVLHKHMKICSFNSSKTNSYWHWNSLETWINDE